MEIHLTTGELDIGWIAEGFAGYEHDKLKGRKMTPCLLHQMLGQERDQEMDPATWSYTAKAYLLMLKTTEFPPT